MSFYREQLEAWLKTIEVEASVVYDIGGMANPIKDRVKSWKVGTYRILDSGAEEIFGKGKGVNYIEFDINLSLAKNGLARFSSAGAIFCLEVFEYVWDPLQALGTIKQLLGQNGIAYMSFPSIYPVHNPANIDYLRYTRQGIIKLLNEAGFGSYKITARKATEGLSSLADFYSKERMRPVKHNNVIFDIGYLVEAVR